MKKNNNDYKTMATMFVKYDIRGFLLNNHVLTEIDVSDENILGIAKDVFKNEPEPIKDVVLYKAIIGYNDVLIGGWNKNGAVRRSVNTVDFIKGICKVFNLLVRMKRNNSYDNYKQAVDTIDSIDVLIRALQGNIEYEKLAAILVDNYMEACLKEINVCENNTESEN